MSGGANVWAPKTPTAISGNTKSVTERFVATANQQTFDLTNFVYVMGTGALEIHKNGLLIDNAVDWIELADTKFSLVVPANVSDVITATAHVGIEGTVPVDPVVPVVDPTDILGTIAARMHAGEAVKVACYGDSTTDGNTTTGRSPNPTSGGDAVGNSNHNLTAPNAWPAKLQTLLRDLYDNTSIATFNAGYSGKRMDDGWALANYDAAVINNPFYGLPDITFIAFGLNDIQTAGSQLYAYIAQTRLLLDKIIAQGTMPVLLTSDASYRNGNNAVRDHKEVVRQLDSAKRSLAVEYGIPLIDMDAALKGFLQDNGDGITWNGEQPDGLHCGDAGHAFKAGVAALAFYNDAAVHTGGVQSINTWDSAASWIGDYTKVYNYPNNEQGGNPLYSTLLPATLPAQGTDLMTLWLWNESPSSFLIYLGIDSENELTATEGPTINLTSTISGVTTSKEIISFGGQSTKRRSDEHFVFGKIPYGLSKITYKKGNGNGNFHAGFKLIEGAGNTTANALALSGPIGKRYLANTGVHVQSQVLDSMNNVVGPFNGETCSLGFRFRATNQGGIVIVNGQAFNGAQSGIDNNLQNCYILFRGVTNLLSIYNVLWDNQGAVVFGSILASSAVQPWTNDEFEGRIEISREGGSQRLNVYDSLYGATTIISVLLPLADSVRWGGVAGGLFYNSDTAAADGTVELLKLTINR